ncbi:hypothetical protein IWX49DRAFT_396357 [Phyllosticta citricarpa]
MYLSLLCSAHGNRSSTTLSPPAALLSPPITSILTYSILLLLLLLLLLLSTASPACIQNQALPLIRRPPPIVPVRSSPEALAQFAPVPSLSYPPPPLPLQCLSLLHLLDHHPPLTVPTSGLLASAVTRQLALSLSHFKIRCPPN